MGWRLESKRFKREFGDIVSIKRAEKLIYDGFGDRDAIDHCCN